MQIAGLPEIGDNQARGKEDISAAKSDTLYSMRSGDPTYRFRNDVRGGCIIRILSLLFGLGLVPGFLNVLGFGLFPDL